MYTFFFLRKCTLWLVTHSGCDMSHVSGRVAGPTWASSVGWHLAGLKDWRAVGCSDRSSMHATPPPTELSAAKSDRRSSVGFLVSSEARTSPPLLPQCNASPLSVNLCSLSWHLPRLAGGHHHRLRDLPVVVFPGELFLLLYLMLKFVPLVDCYMYRLEDLDCDAKFVFYLPLLLCRF